MNKIRLFHPRYTAEDLVALSEVLESGWTAPGARAKAFEEAWKRYTGHANALFVSSATAGLHLALHVLKEPGWPADAEVISTPITFVSTNHAILYAGLRPVFADVDEHLCLSRKTIESRLSPRTRAVMFVGLGGNLGDFEAVRALCQERKLKLIVDAAHMAGTRPVPTGDAVVYSFQAVKNLSVGDGGMLCLADVEQARRARRLAWMGIDKSTSERAQDKSYSWKYDVTELGWKYAGNDVAAALGLSRLKSLDRENAYRRQLADWYTAALRRGACRPEHAGFELIPSVGESSRHLFQILLNETVDRAAVMYFLERYAIETGVHYRQNSDYPMYRDQPPCERAQQVSERILSLPMHPRLEHHDIERVATTLLLAVKEARR